MKKTLVITGCSTGFGREAALRFAKRGDRVYATMRGIKGKNAEHAVAPLANQATHCSRRVLVRT
jgi:NAD(P)-dependent dehydrogenase (short-subunit alcohol dehydrogenase family)